MEKLIKILEEVITDKYLFGLIKGQIKIPYLDDFDNVNKKWNAHPPALVPAFLGHGASYKGIIKHFFVERKVTFVDYFLEWGYMLEIARNVNQFYTLLVLQLIMLQEELNSDIKKFCMEIGFEGTEKVLEFAEQYGDDRDMFNQLFNLDIDTPLTYLKSLEHYTGDYPSSEKLLNIKSLPVSSSWEIANNLINSNVIIPDWLKRDKDKKDLFTYYFNSKEFDKAWLTLNSHGWKPEDVSECLIKLKKVANEELFNLVADNWIYNWKQVGKSSDLGY